MHTKIAGLAATFALLAGITSAIAEEQTAEQRLIETYEYIIEKYENNGSALFPESMIEDMKEALELFKALEQQRNAVPVIVDDNLHKKLFRINEDWNIPGTSTITRGMLDEAANVYCEWETSADIDANRNISNVQQISRTCKEAEPSDTAQYAGGTETNSHAADMGGVSYFLTPDTSTNTVVDGIATGPNNAGVVSEYRRIWDFNANQVCLHSQEGQLGQPLYINDDMGCFPIPDNQHVDAIKSTLAP